MSNDRARVFTSWKLDLQRYLLSDPRLKPADKLVAICILHHVNIEIRTAFVSAETISDETDIGVRHVKRAFGRLRQTGWLETRRTRTANIFGFSERNMNALKGRQATLRQGRQSKRVTSRGDSGVTHTPYREHLNESPFGRCFVLRSNARALAILEKKLKKGTYDEKEHKAGMALCHAIVDQPSSEVGHDLWHRANRLLSEYDLAANSPPA